MKKANIKIFAKNVKYLRKQHGLTMQMLADELGCGGKTTVMAWESGKYPTVERLFVISEFFGVNIDDLLKADLEWRYDA